MRYRFLVAALICAGLIAPEIFAAPTTYMVEMRDGVHLATDVYLPRQGDGPWPVMLGRTPYDKRSSSDLSFFTSSGIAVVVQDVRGRYGSEGEAIPFVNDGWGALQDGYDTVEWIRAQDWCNGKVATIGASAGGMTQMQLAGSAPEGLVGQLISVAPLSIYHTTMYNGGVFRKILTEGWLSGTKWPTDVLELIKSHPTYDDYWRVQNLGERVEHVDWPVTLVGGWFDIFQQGTIDAFTEIQTRGGPNARNNVHLIVGAWTHGVNNTKVGDLTFPEKAKMPSAWPETDDWFDAWLFDEPLSPEPPSVLYYTMGEIPYGRDIPGHEWRSADTWPPPQSQEIPFYLTELGDLHRDTPQTASLGYSYDPKQPVPTVGGQNLILPAGSFDQREVEEREDVLVFTTPVLEEPLEVTGHLTAVLYVSTSAQDADFSVRLSDVYPDGRSMLLTDGIRRLSFRNSFSETEAVVPGEVYRLEVDLWSTSMVFNEGHSIRIAVTSSNTPRYEPNPHASEQTVYLGGDRASHVLLPLVGEDTGIDGWEAWAN